MKVCVVGGGTAGWISALYTKKVNPSYEVTLIESDEIGILGAGEGATPHLIDLLVFLDISIKDLVEKVNISIKNGIKFSNWSNDGGSYIHPFSSTCEASNDYNFSLNYNLESDTSFSHIFGSKFDDDLSEYSFVEKLSRINKVPFLEDVELKNNDFLKESFSLTSIHFDATLLAGYLKTLAESRGIKRKEGIVNEIITDKDGYITELKTNNGSVKTDFVFDCTGFKRLIIGKFYKSEWKSHKESLPVNRAIPFFLPIDKKIPPYTESIAMDYGWMWKIPLQNRYGCGYVFDDDMISPERAKNEVDSFFGFEVDSPRSFSFDAGHFRRIWIKNSLAVGLSSGFIEPLEATSIWQAVRVLRDLFSSYGALESKNEKIKNKFNDKYCLDTQEIVDFIYLHYITDKKNTKFWKDFLKNNKVPDFVDYILSIIKERPIDPNIDFIQRSNMFSVPSYSYVMIGNNILTKDLLKSHLSLMKTDKTNDYLRIVINQKIIIKKLIDHNDFLIKGGGSL